MPYSQEELDLLAQHMRSALRDGRGHNAPHTEWMWRQVNGMKRAREARDKSLVDRQYTKEAKRK